MAGILITIGVAAYSMVTALKTAEKVAERLRIEEAPTTRLLHDEIARMREEVYETQRNVEILEEIIEKEHKRSFDDFLKHEKQQKHNLAKLAHKKKAIRKQGNNIGLFGITSTGKSTMINSLLGEKVADTGVGETTKEMISYKRTAFILWDTPGRNDEQTYSNEKFILFIKSLTKRIVLIQSTIKENLDLMRLLDNLGLGYDIVVNKFDDIGKDEQLKFQYQIQREITAFRLRENKNLFFLSAKYPQMFPSWLKMVDYLTEKSFDYNGDDDIITDEDNDDDDIITNSD